MGENHKDFFFKPGGRRKPHGTRCSYLRSEEKEKKQRCRSKGQKSFPSKHEHNQPPEKGGSSLHISYLELEFPLLPLMDPLDYTAVY